MQTLQCEGFINTIEAMTTAHNTMMVMRVRKAMLLMMLLKFIIIMVALSNKYHTFAIKQKDDKIIWWCG